MNYIPLPQMIERGRCKSRSKNGSYLAVVQHITYVVVTVSNWNDFGGLHHFTARFLQRIVNSFENLFC